MPTEKLGKFEIIGADKRSDVNSDDYQERLARLGELADSMGVSHDELKLSPEQSKFFERVNELIMLGKAVIVNGALLGTRTRWDQPDKPDLSDLRSRLCRGDGLEELGASIITATSVFKGRCRIGDRNFVNANFGHASWEITEERRGTEITIGNDNYITGLTAENYSRNTRVAIGNNNQISSVDIRPTQGPTPIDVTVGNNNDFSGNPDTGIIMVGRVVIKDRNTFGRGSLLPNVDIGNDTEIDSFVELPSGSFVEDGRKVTGGSSTVRVIEGTSVEEFPLRPSKDPETTE